MAVQVPALTDPALEVAAQALAFKAKVIIVVLITNLAKGISSSSLVIRGNPKQLNSGQYHVFTTSLCKRDQKIHKRAMNSVEPVVPRY